MSIESKEFENYESKDSNIRLTSLKTYITNNKGHTTLIRKKEYENNIPYAPLNGNGSVEKRKLSYKYKQQLNALKHKVKPRKQAIHKELLINEKNHKIRHTGNRRLIIHRHRITPEQIFKKAPQYIKNLIRKYFPSNQYGNALLVCFGESGFHSHALNKNRNNSIDRGLFQINSVHRKMYAGKNIFDPETNVKVASLIFKKAGSRWSPWYAARKMGIQ